MGEIVNLNRARKAKTKAADRAEAAGNRARHGRSKAERARLQAERAQTDRTLDGAFRAPEGD